MFARLSISTAAVAAAGMLLAPASASAQSYSPYGGQSYGYENRYDRYDSDRRYARCDGGGGAAGGVVGATIGAVAGSQIAARGRRTEGSILGGVLGAVIGAGVGSSSDRDCGRYSDEYRYSSYGDDRYGYPSHDRYDDQAYGYDRYGDYDRSGYGYDRYASGSGYSTDRYGCRTVETRTRTRDGRLVTRYEQSCPDRY
jgi:hypothetical protein